MSNLDEIKLLSVDILDSYSENILFIDKIMKALKMSIGWHYVLDMAWILEEIKDILPGSTILDAGAGSGLMQYLLALKGYNVISADMMARQTPWKLKLLFNFDVLSSNKEIEHEYITHLKKDYSMSKMSLPRKIVRRLSSILLNYNYLLFVLKSVLRKKNHGKITLYQTDLTQMDFLNDNTIDAIVSVSALEHNDHQGIEKAMKEMTRVLKPGGKMLITVSATKDSDWLHKPSMGWCFSEDSLRELFTLSKNAKSNWNEYSELFKKLINSKAMQDRLPPDYYNSGNNGMPWGIWDPKYMPVGISKFKRDDYTK